MQKRLVQAPIHAKVAEETWFDLNDMGRVELTSEDAEHPIEGALLSSSETGWRAAEPGTQSIRLVFHHPQRVRRIRLLFQEASAERTQEFELAPIAWTPRLCGQR